jgi:hypothetical protein
MIYPVCVCPWSPAGMRRQLELPPDVEFSFVSAPADTPKDLLRPDQHVIGGDTDSSGSDDGGSSPQPFVGFLASQLNKRGKEG